LYIKAFLTGSLDFYGSQEKMFMLYFTLSDRSLTCDDASQILGSYRKQEKNGDDTREALIRGQIRTEEIFLEDYPY
jgi:hypothetical protein